MAAGTDRTSGTQHYTHVYAWNGVGAGAVGVNVTSFLDTGLVAVTWQVYLMIARNSAREAWAPDGIWAPTVP